MLSDVQSAANCMSVPDAKQLIGFVQQQWRLQCRHRSQDARDIERRKKLILFQNGELRGRERGRKKIIILHYSRFYISACREKLVTLDVTTQSKLRF